MRFPFGRGARQREIDGLRQRIAELQDEVKNLEENVLAESPDVETTDAYRSVQLLRESMRREELATLHQELAGLEARLGRLTPDRQPASSATEGAVAVTSPNAGVAAPQGTEVVAEPSDELGASATTQSAAEAGPLSIPAPVTGWGLPSERAIIEPPLPTRPTAEAAPPPEEVVDTEAGAAVDGRPPSLGEEGAAVEVGEPLGATEAEAAVEVAAGEDIAAQPIGEEPEESVTAGEAEPFAEEPELETAPEEAAAAVGSEEAETAAPVLATFGAGTDIDESGAVVGVPTEARTSEGAAEAEAPGEPAEEPQVAEAPPRRRPVARVAVAAVLLLAIGVVVAVAAFEGGLIAPVGMSPPTVVPDTRPTLSPPTAAPTRPPPTVPPTLPPTPPPPTAPPLAAPPADEAAPEALSAPEPIEAAIDNGVIAAPAGFTGALLREGPVVSSRNLQFLPNGTRVEILDGTASGSGFRWLRVRSAEGVIGWVISTVLGR